MKTIDGKHTTPLRAAKLAYIRLGQQAELDEGEALAEVSVSWQEVTTEELADFRRHLQNVDRRVRKMLNL